MDRLYKILLISVLIFRCQNQNKKGEILSKVVAFNQELADELKELAKVDQIAAYIRQGKYKKMSDEEWKSFKDSVYTTHQIRMKEIFDQHGFVGFDLAGEDGSRNFWLMVQHSDHTPEFQEAVLHKMKAEVLKGNAHSSEFAFLTDRVMLNTGKSQLYGTQVDYNFNIAQAFPINLTDSLNVNKRRKEIGMESLEEYLNFMTKSNFEMNKEYYKKKGILAPQLYTIK